MFFQTWGPVILKCYGPRATLIRHRRYHKQNSVIRLN